MVLPGEFLPKAKPPPTASLGGVCFGCSPLRRRWGFAFPKGVRRLERRQADLCRNGPGVGRLRCGQAALPFPIAPKEVQGSARLVCTLENSGRKKFGEAKHVLCRQNTQYMFRRRPFWLKFHLSSVAFTHPPSLHLFEALRVCVPQRGSQPGAPAGRPVSLRAWRGPAP